MKIVVATHNEGKLVEIRNILTEQLSAAAQGIELVSAGSLDLADPAETGVTFEENALLKARFVAAATGLPAIADDSGLIVDVMGNAPGILSARWSGTHGDDAANNRLLLAQIEDIPDDDRTARFRCAAALVVPVESDGDGLGEFHETVALGEMPGTIVRHPHGMNGFGYDPIFMPDEQPQSAQDSGELLTSAQMTPEQKNAISHRGKALRALVPAVKALLAD
ncbi:RdgB/HAM1 family non-canonical purine NTP pyrophosphatase [Bifidobacterium pseudolongum subsp. globosum]|uniref:dITP/XTP pyrophosphatase n=1 Tax=Bifidobacterium pseudolongum TaxID=1694 RepID=A0A4S4F651_9BIFI|nr:RdgB/HAM1 family non-canonical purine NTP pyrophosphatase [Bifidobacterium pseudolongum]MBS6344405.1 RdgB/HAM1 family non-canonical purine NTP pyrophosphatase [Bifidobacterium pseudolongum]MCI1195009.1 RdgB/HAM1 family non-canonical purine NTP pyrophosphatase [Bifidobacterium pseudolongum subsp. globosum]RYQ01465.1 non-canonical purine NTP pyrophosphatase [Bifidobacterium pseudolongum subsp. globosum]THG25269.1 RdgB/HAM1 family non-canonical purine NTP pyrophosphatase [Bifidobacterium pseudo